MVFFRPTASPSFTEVPGDVEVEEGSPLRLWCGVQGWPPPLVYWVRYGAPHPLHARRTPPLLNQEWEDRGECLRI